jgi:predicted O-methyltransferase YrrM
MGVEIINSGKKLHLTCVDHWKGSVEHKDVPADLMFQFIKNIEPVDSVITVLKYDSADAADLFEDGDFYFVFIDAGHEYDDVMRDVTAWLPKVKKGGILAGDDYKMAGVTKAVKELLPHHQTNQGDWPYWWVRV